MVRVINLKNAWLLHEKNSPTGKIMPVECYKRAATKWRLRENIFATHKTANGCHKNVTAGTFVCNSAPVWFGPAASA